MQRSLGHEGEASTPAQGRMGAEVEGRRRLSRAGMAGIFALGILAVAGIFAGCSDSRGNTVVASGPASVVTSPDTITVVGEGTVSSAPDEAVVTLTVETDGSDPGSAMTENSTAVTNVVERLKQEGVDEDDIETANVSVFPIRSYNPDTGKESLEGYRCQNSIRVTLASAEEVGRVLSAAVDAGANIVSGPVWRLADNTEAVARALKEATGNARAKAEALVAAQGVKLGDVLMMSENSVQVPVYQDYEGMYFARDSAAGAIPATPISPASLDITAIVTVTYVLAR